ncbi:hypothetical protein AC1031_009666 [Aphanomyces cochlioides]|nr:hypothetical protein AC1031_009666 [Aphanomyces cochlioides]
MSAFFESIYHNKTSSELSGNVITLYDASSNTFAMRYIVDIPYHIQFLMTKSKTTFCVYQAQHPMELAWNRI